MWHIPVVHPPWRSYGFVGPKRALCPGVGRGNCSIRVAPIIIIPQCKGCIYVLRSDCSNYRGITLLSSPGKVFAQLLARIKPTLLSHRRIQQSGFTPRRSTCDRILTVQYRSATSNVWTLNIRGLCRSSRCFRLH